MSVGTFTRKAPTYIERLMSDFDFSEFDAAAIMGNAGHESGGLTLFQEIRPRRGGRGGFGWFQWTGPRRRAFEAYCDDEGLDPRSDDANYGFLVKELRGSEKAAVNKTKRARSLADKVKAFELAFERAARDAKHYDRRVQWAERALAAWNEAGAIAPWSTSDTALGTGAGMLRRAREHIGEIYRNIQVPKDDPNWSGPWDCAEFVSWLAYQEAGILYGCVDNQASPSRADSYTGAWKRDADRLGKRVSVEQAAATVGGIVLRYPPAPGKMGHIALCDGKGGTVEAKGRKFGVVFDTVQGRKWDTGVLVPGISYDSGPPVKYDPPEVIYERGAPNLSKVVVAKIQRALAARGFDPGEIDGEFGPKTEAAVVAFQESEGLVVDGAVGPQTAAELGITLVEKTPLPQDQVLEGAPDDLLLLILSLLSKEKPMADILRSGRDTDTIKLLLPLLLRSALSGRGLNLRDLLFIILTGKPLATATPTLDEAWSDLGTSGRSPNDLASVLLPLLYERLTGEPIYQTTMGSPDAAPDTPEKTPLTTVNGALGQTVGKLLDGKKTGIGVLGLLATTVLPMFFPQLLPIAAVVKGTLAAGGEAVQQVPIQDQATMGGSIIEVAKPIFAALTGWGVLGKFDKWFNRGRQ